MGGLVRHNLNSRVSSSCSTSDTRRVNLVTNPIIDSVEICKSTYNQGPSSHAIALLHLNSTLYTTIPLIKLQIELYFVKQNGQRTYKYLVLRRDKSYFVKSHSNSSKKVSETDIIKMFVLDWQLTYGMFGECAFQQTVGILMDAYCVYYFCLFVPLLVWGRLHIMDFQKKWKEAIPIL